ncbi:MAG TPA: phospholipase D family protein [Xanthomonadaceae bacterium]|nr:phospholipase D family protein [Xanthomonadaceae bacterium]
MLCLFLAACGPSRSLLRESADIVDHARPHALTCDRVDRCAVASPLLDLAGDGRHRVISLEGGESSLLMRIHLIRAARETIDLQSYIFDTDVSGQLVLDELLAAARRGVRVRVLLDQLFSLDDPALLAYLSRAHANFEIKLYNPTFGEARTQKLEFAASLFCCFWRFNQRMHNKLLLVDGAAGLTGGRNVQDRYFDWDREFDFRDRDVLLIGPEAAEMQSSFDTYWAYDRSVSAHALGDVARRVVDDIAKPPSVPGDAAQLPRVKALLAEAVDADAIAARFGPLLFEVERAQYFWDRPSKPYQRETPAERDTTRQIKAMIAGTRVSLWLQTPYLVLSRNARALFQDLADREAPPRMVVSTNSLAATDAFFVYALSHKYKRMYVRRFGFEIHEWKPYPADAAWRLDAWDWLVEGIAEAKPADGPRIGMHAKSLVIDDHIVMIGSHNFTPRSADLNTESGVIVWDQTFARHIRAEIERDIAPGNAWTIARRQRSPVIGLFSGTMSGISESLPIFDLWPWRYTTSYELNEGCDPKPPAHARFFECYHEVGDFPEAASPLKRLPTALVTAFGLGLEPIL